MAEEKKPGKPTGMISDREATERIIGLLLLLFFLAALASSLLSYLDSSIFGASGSLWNRIVEYFLGHIWPVWKLIAIIISALSVAGIIYNMRKLGAINIEENKIFNPKSVGPVAGKDGEEIIEKKNTRWEKILGYANSDNPSDWRMAVIEADAMLEEVLRVAGYEGESVGDMLKTADKNEFLTVDDAWEAHKVRNSIAHSGEGFQLNERETKRVIALFEKVFTEFEII